MAAAMARGWASAEDDSPSEMLFTDSGSGRATALAKEVGGRAVESNEELQAAVTAAELQLGSRGRVLLRPSGTEPLVRVMVEAATQEEADDVAQKLAEVVKERLPLT